MARTDVPTTSSHRRPTAAASRSYDYWGLAASTVIHLALIAAGGLLVLPAGGTIPGVPIDTAWDRTTEEVVPESITLDLPVTESAASPQSEARTAFAAILPHREVRLPTAVRVPTIPGRMLQVPLSDGVTPPVTTPGTGTGGTDGDGTGGGAAAPGRSMFPIESSVNRYVFVVDSSRSMNHPYHGPAKTRLGRVKIEMWRSIYAMSSEQKYFVIFFNTRAIPMPADRMVAGGQENQGELVRWTARLRADGTTDPEEALLLAIRLQPDVIYFLTDGDFNHRVVRKVTQANTGRIRIDTIGLGDTFGSELLEELAAKNGGVYRRVIEADDLYWEEASTTDTAASTQSTRRGATLTR